jgi:putative ABC transport system permease protein
MALILCVLVMCVYLALLGQMTFWPKGRRTLLLALRSLWLHKLRAFLSVLGIIIGTGAVIALMAFGEGSMHDALEDIRRMGATNIIVRSVKPPDDASSQRRSFVAFYGITYADYNNSFTPLFDAGIADKMVPMRIFPQEVRRLEKLHNGRLVATTPDYAEVNDLQLASGRFLTSEDDIRMRNVAVLGSSTAAKLFPFEDPIGQTVRLGVNFYLVVGLVQERMPTGGTGGSQAAENFNDDVYIPLSTCRARYGERIFIRQSGSRSGEKVDLHQVTLKIDAQVNSKEGRDRVQAVGDQIRKVLKDSHQKQDWAVTVPLDRLEEAERAQNRYQMLLVAIASISLIVGGIGIMNIMLATVTERTREIGIRRALGAKQRDITLQFLIEAVVQTTVGGMFGVIGGLTVVLVVPWLAEKIWETHLPARINVFSIFLSLDVAVTVGVVFGLYPARRASLLDPIEALRHE